MKKHRKYPIGMKIMQEMATMRADLKSIPRMDLHPPSSNTKETQFHLEHIGGSGVRHKTGLDAGERTKTPGLDRFIAPY